MNERNRPISTGLRADRLKMLRALAEKLAGDDPASRAVWRRMVLGRLAGLLLDDRAKLTGADLRAMLKTLAGDAKSAPTATTGDRLPPEFENIVQEIYGVNLQRDAKERANPPSKNGTNEKREPARQKQ